MAASDHSSLSGRAYGQKRTVEMRTKYGSFTYLVLQVEIGRRVGRVDQIAIDKKAKGFNGHALAL